ncbi:MAG: hypothetical protein COB50_05395 [Thiotrichales bacterium]|nr:MAG: hypothetical protein COB50_05395 [Thiotrichales bacterium]
MSKEYSDNINNFIGLVKLLHTAISLDENLGVTENKPTNNDLSTALLKLPSDIDAYSDFTQVRHCLKMINRLDNYFAEQDKQPEVELKDLGISAKMKKMREMLTPIVGTYNSQNVDEGFSSFFEKLAIFSGVCSILCFLSAAITASAVCAFAGIFGLLMTGISLFVDTANPSDYTYGKYGRNTTLSDTVSGLENVFPHMQII